MKKTGSNDKYVISDLPSFIFLHYTGNHLNSNDVLPY